MFHDGDKESHGVINRFHLHGFEQLQEGVHSDVFRSLLIAHIKACKVANLIKRTFIQKIESFHFRKATMCRHSMYF